LPQYSLIRDRGLSPCRGLLRRGNLCRGGGRDPREVRGGVAGSIFKFLLFPGIPSADCCHVPGDPADLGDVMAPALRADRFAAERAVSQRFHDPVRTVGMVQGAHDLESCRLPADGASAVLEVRRGEDEVADRAFVPAIPIRDP
jgi:hypothetical protein